MKLYRPVLAGAPARLENSRPVYVIDDLRELHGPAAGVVTLPVHLDWTPAATYDLASPVRVRTMYATVLREAMSETDLAEHLNATLLVRHWRSLVLPEFIRDSWEDAHPELRGR